MVILMSEAENINIFNQTNQVMTRNIETWFNI